MKPKIPSDKKIEKLLAKFQSINRRNMWWHLGENPKKKSKVKPHNFLSDDFIQSRKIDRIEK